MNIDGRVLAETVFSHLQVRGSSLGILIAGSDSVTDSFVRAKARVAEKIGVAVVRETISGDATTDDALGALASLSAKTDGVIVQLPLPSQIDTEKVLEAIPPEKDVDGISPAPKVRPPVAEAVREILESAHVDVKGKSAIVVGSGRLVGRPCASLLTAEGAFVSILKRGDSLEPLKNADIIVLGAGEPGLVKPEHVKDGVVLIDAGTSESSGKIAGDADPACAKKASVFTPVPGGVGPVAVAMIFKNLSVLAGKAA